jgi:5-formyltetrahydrofolate cyclo-ligase
MSTSKSLRAKALAARRSLPQAYRQVASKKIVASIIELEAFLSAKRIGIFLPMPDEVDVRPIMERAWLQQKQVFVPYIAAKEKPLQFLAYDRNSALTLNRNGISEPDPATSVAIDPRDLEFVVTPLVAFDRRCWRIGMGAGYYDRTFAFLREDSDAQTLLCGAAFAIQEVPEISAQTWDVPLHKIVTESEIIEAP